MLYDRINLLQGADIQNLVVASGTTFPANPDIGELFFKSNEDKLYVYKSTGWAEAGSGGGGSGSVTSVAVNSSTPAISVSGSPITTSGTISLTANNFTTTTAGVVPASGGGTTNFLRADGTWSPANASSVSVLYGTGSFASTWNVSQTAIWAGTKSGGPAVAFSNSSASANNRLAYWQKNINGTIALYLADDTNATFNDIFTVTRSGNTATNIELTSNAITLTGPVTGTSFSGVGTNLTALNASNLTTGTVATARLGTGTADSTTFLRGDGTWAAPSVTAISGASVTGTTGFDLVSGRMANDDLFRIRIGGTATDGGFVELATSDNGTEPIYVRQYTGSLSFASIVNSATLLDANGDTLFPNTVTASAFSGNGSLLTALNASNLSTGTVAPARLGSGTADSTTFLRGDGTWAVPAGGGGGGSYTAGAGLTLTGNEFSLTSPVATSFLGSGTANSSTYLRGDGTWAPVSAGSATSLSATATSPRSSATTAVYAGISGATSLITMTVSSAAAGNKVGQITYNSVGTMNFEFVNDGITAGAQFLSVSRLSGTNDASGITLRSQVLTFTPVAPAATSAGGAINITAGPGGSTSGAGGAMNLRAGSSTTTGNGGAALFESGNGAGTGQGGALTLSTGDGAGSGGAASNGGSMTVSTGAGGVTGAGGTINIFTGDGGSTSGSSGPLNIYTGATTAGASGAMTIYTSNVAGAFASGAMTIRTGDATSNTNVGNIDIYTGASSSATTGTGHIFLRPGGISSNGLRLWKDGRVTLGENTQNSFSISLQAPAQVSGSYINMFRVIDNTTAVNLTNRTNSGVGFRKNTTTNVTELYNFSGAFEFPSGLNAYNPIAITAYTLTSTGGAWGDREICRFMPAHAGANGGAGQSNAVLVNKTAHSFNGALQVAGGSELVGNTVVAATQPADNTASSGFGPLEVRGNTNTADFNGTTATVRVRSTNATTAGIYLQNSTSGTTITDGTQVAVEANGVDSRMWNYESGFIRFATANTERLRILSTGVVQPGADNTQTLGASGVRWSVIYAGTGTINTSDANEKQDIEVLSAAELRVATAIKGLVKKFRFKDAVAVKGAAARKHVGVVAQEVQAAFAAEGLDASEYALFCSDTWYELNGEEVPAGTEGAVQKTRMGIRYEELLAFVIAAM